MVIRDPSPPHSRYFWGARTGQISYSAPDPLNCGFLSIVQLETGTNLMRIVRFCLIILEIKHDERKDFSVLIKNMIFLSSSQTLIVIFIYYFILQGGYIFQRRHPRDETENMIYKTQNTALLSFIL